MSTVSVTNTDAQLSASTLLTEEDAATIEALHTFDRDPNPPFAVSSGSAVVANLIAEQATYASGALNGQFAFPATQNASAGTNTLDDYEEGVWTPVLTFITPGNLNVAYSAQSGLYTKIGNLVMLHFHIITTTWTHTTASGALNITGVPFAAGGLGGHGGMWFTGITKANYTNYAGRVFLGTSILDIVASGSGQTAIQVTAADMPSGTQQTLIGTVMYSV